MGWWGALPRQMLLSIFRHPTVQNYAQKGMQSLKNNPSMKQSVSAMSNTWAKTKRQVKASISAGGFAGNKNRQNGGYVKWVVDMWNKYKASIMSFIAVNFMGIILFVQFGSALWTMLWKLVSDLYAEKAIDKKEMSSRAIKTRVQDSPSLEKHKSEEKISKLAEESREQKDTSILLADFENSSSETTKHSLEQMENELFGQLGKTDFSTSFKFRMNENDSFVSSLDSTSVSGDRL